MTKAEEILDRHLELRGWKTQVPKNGNLYNTLLDAVSEGLSDRRMDKVEVWEILVMVSGNEISLEEAHIMLCSVLNLNEEKGNGA